MKFEMRKWYLDCVAEDGAAVIGYAARLRWGWLRLGYGALLCAFPGRPVHQAQSFHPGDLTISDRSIAWRHASFNVSGCWQGGSGHAPAYLYQDGDGAIDWHCLTAYAQTRIELPDGGVLSGLGYVEELRLTIPPWRLPFNVLRWGRFIGDAGTEHRIWIDWRGGLERRWVWSEAGLHPGDASDTLNDEQVRTSACSLSLHPERTLREAPLAGSLLGGARGLGRLLPGGLGRATEAKWLSRGKLQTPRASIDGWAIHEVVRWR